VKGFWREVEQFIKLKHQSVLETKKKQALDKHLEFLVDQTEKYTEKVAQNLKGSTNEGTKPPPNSLQASTANAGANLDVKGTFDLPYLRWHWPSY